MANQLGLTLKHVAQSGDVFYIAAHYARLVWPTNGRENYVLFDAGDRAAGDAERQIYGGTVYVMNSAGKTIDILTLGQIAPQSSAA